MAQRTLLRCPRCQIPVRQRAASVASRQALVGDEMIMSPKREVAMQTDGSVVVYVTPPAFMRLPRVSVTLTAEQYSRYVEWRMGHGRIHELLPELAAGEREKLMSGIGDDDFDRLFPDDDE